MSYFTFYAFHRHNIDSQGHGTFLSELKYRGAQFICSRSVSVMYYCSVRILNILFVAFEVSIVVIRHI